MIHQRVLGLFAGVAAGLACAAGAPAPSAPHPSTPHPSTNGRWDATVSYRGVAIPFHLELRQSGDTVRASFFDGSRPTNPSAPARLEGERLHLVFPSYASALDLELKGERLEGSYTRNRVSAPVQAVRAAATPAAASRGPVPAIGGEWITSAAGSKSERAWRFIVHQSGGRVEAAILRVDGDTGTLDGAWADGAFHLSHFAGERPARLEVRPDGPGRLKLVLDDNEQHAELAAVRPQAAAAAGLVTADPTRFTGVKDAGAPFRFAAPDLGGGRVADTDARFRGKVVLVDVMGSWCPNCHDEAPYLQTLYQRHARDGLEVVALDFEQAPDQLADPQRLRAFVARYHLDYTVLLAGLTKDAQQRLPQATNLAAWPTTFFIGRDGRVKAVHVGFTSPGSGARDAETRAGMEREVRTLLAEPGPKP